MTQAQAREIGAMALFGEKYGDAVRVVSVGEWAKELCGGTHAERTTQLGLVTLLGESSIGSGVRQGRGARRTDAYSFLAREHAIVGQVTEMLKARPEELPERISAMIGRLRDAERDLERLRREQVLAAAGSADRGGPRRRLGALPRSRRRIGSGRDDVRAMVLDARGRLGTDRPVVVAVTGTKGGRPVVVVATNEGPGAGHQGGRPRPDGGSGARRRRRRQGRPGAGRRQRPRRGPEGPVRDRVAGR
jgi:alanyl-tRNA synthetase